MEKCDLRFDEKVTLLKWLLYASHLSFLDELFTSDEEDSRTADERERCDIAFDKLEVIGKLIQQVISERPLPF